MRFIPLIILKYIKLEKITRLDQKEIISYVKICSKVFTDFIKNNYMNNKIIIIIAIVIAIGYKLYSKDKIPFIKKGKIPFISKKTES